MKKNILKKTVILSLSLFITEIINVLICILFRLLIKDKILFYCHNLLMKYDRLTDVLMVSISLIMYYFIGRTVFAKFSSKEKKYSAIIVSILTIISCLVAAVISNIVGGYYMTHIIFCSPLPTVIGNYITNFNLSNNLLGAFIIIFFTPISVLLIWLFSKIGKKKQIDD